MWQDLLEQIIKGNRKVLARTISLIENEHPEYDLLMESLPLVPSAKIIGVTGAPGAGKSTLVDGLIGEIVKQGKKVAVLCVDPSSPFNLGAVLGDRIRMSDWYTNDNVFIRSLATRGSMGGLHPKIIEISDLLKVAGFDYVIVETVGVGQSEIEIVGLADVTVVVVVPEGGDEVQTMKAGLMEIADIFVVNKSDRPDADIFVTNLRQMLAPVFSTQKHEIPIIKTVANEKTGLEILFKSIQSQLTEKNINEKKIWLLTERAFYLIQKERMKDKNKTALKLEITKELEDHSFNLYKFVQLHK